jgi:hypothetical protein
MLAKAVADEAVAAKTTEETTTKMVADEAAVKSTAHEAMVKVVDQGAAGAQATAKSAGSGSSSSPAPVVGTNRATAVGGSTPSSKQFRYAWKPRYAEQLLSCFFLFISLHLHYILLEFFAIQRTSLWQDASSRQVQDRECSQFRSSPRCS